jgi:hypothetical protein
MQLLLRNDEAVELHDLLRGALADLSHEIADTDSWEYRKVLRQRRDRLEAVRRQLSPAAAIGNTLMGADSR